MIQCGSSFGLLHEAAHAFLVRSDIRGQNLQRNFAIQPGVLRQINLAHPARAELRADFIAAEFCADVDWHTERPGGERFQRDWPAVIPGQLVLMAGGCIRVRSTTQYSSVFSFSLANCSSVAFSIQ